MQTGSTARREAIEKRLALREATAAEFTAVSLQNSRQKYKSLRAAAASAKARNDKFIQVVREAHKLVNDARLMAISDRSSASMLLAREKARYLHKIEQVYPAWQERQQRERIERLRALENRKRAVDRRRYLAKKVGCLRCHP